MNGKEILTFDMSENAKGVFLKRYSKKNEAGLPAETIDETFERVATVVSSIEEDKKFWKDIFFELIAARKFVPNTPTFTGAGTRLGQLAACFVLPIKDDMGKDKEGIFSTLRNAALIQQTGGGIGFSFSNLRPRGDLVGDNRGIATGPVGFMRVYDAAFGEIAQGGIRRSANMAILRVDHPDIEEFISAKVGETTLTNFNISVGVTDKFMQAVQSDENFDLINPRTKLVTRTIKARKLFNEIARYAYQNGEPGIVFLDRANRDNPVPALFTLEATNPCAEQFLGPYENCCLGSINLSKHVRGQEIDWVELRSTVFSAVQFLDNVVSVNKYVDEIPELKDTAFKIRRIGLGIMGLADVFYKLGIRYGSAESLELASQIMEFIRFWSMMQSVWLSITKGAFPEIDNSVFAKDNFSWKYPRRQFKYSLDFGMPTITEQDWRDLADSIRKNGIRNAVITTIAPTGTIGTISDVEGYGCEPVFALAYTRHVIDVQTGNRQELLYTSPIFKKTIELNYNGTGNFIINEVALTGNGAGSTILSDKDKNVFVVSQDITVDEHILMQSVLQNWIDNSISKTCNFPKSATVQDVEFAYMSAWKNGCKGLTVYVTGSRDKVVLETKETQLEKTGVFDPAAMVNCTSGVCSI